MDIADYSDCTCSTLKPVDINSTDVIDQLDSGERYPDVENTPKSKKKKPSVNASKPKRPPYKQKFRSDWQVEFKWLNERNGQSMCTLCNTAVTGSGFHMRRHSLSALHMKNVKSVANTKNVKEAMFNSDKTLKDQVREAEAKLTFMICDKNLPFQLMDTLTEVCKHIFPDSKIARNLKIKRKKATTLAITKLAPYVKGKLVSKLQVNKFSLIVDETTDVSTKKSIVLVVRFWDEIGIKDRFLDLVEVKNCTAEGLYETIKTVLDENKIPYTNLVGFGADNCNVMMGQKGGVQAKLKQISPDLMVQGCVCHSAHLCASKACTKLPNTIEQFARDVYAYFKNSSCRQDELQKCQIFKNENPHKMLRVSQTRWLSLRVSFELILPN